MDDELGAVAAGERSEHAASVTSLAVHCIGALGSMLLLQFKLRDFDGWRTTLISVFWFLLNLTNSFRLRRCGLGKTSEPIGW